MSNTPEPEVGRTQFSAPALCLDRGRRWPCETYRSGLICSAFSRREARWRRAWLTRCLRHRTHCITQSPQPNDRGRSAAMAQLEMLVAGCLIRRRDRSVSVSSAISVSAARYDRYSASRSISPFFSSVLGLNGRPTSLREPDATLRVRRGRLPDIRKLEEKVTQRTFVPCRLPGRAPG